MADFDVPLFRPDAKDTPMSEFSLRLIVEFAEGDTHIIGTATVVCGHLAITAAHNLDDILTRFGPGARLEGNVKISAYAVRVIQVLPGPAYRVYNVHAVWMNGESDIAILHLGLQGRSDPDAPIDWKQPIVNVVAPPLGSRVAAFGYHSSVIKRTPNPGGGYHLDIRDQPTTSVGVVEEILPRGQSAGRFTFPCLRVAARYDGGMSGGPVYNEAGDLCGIISGSYGVTDGPPISYVTALWPMFRIMITVNHEGEPTDAHPALDLALDRLIYTAGLETLDPAWFPGRTLPTSPLPPRR
jgi:hypothetical protein